MGARQDCCSSIASRSDVGARVFGSLLLNHRQIVQTHCQVAAVLVDQWCDRSKLPREPDRVAECLCGCRVWYVLVFWC